MTALQGRYPPPALSGGRLVSRTLLDMELAELDRLVRQLPAASVIRLESGSTAMKQLEIVRSVCKQYGLPMPSKASRLYRNRIKPEQKLFEEKA